MENTCIMLSTPLYTPVDLRCIFDEVDLVGEGIIFDHHITVVFAKEMIIPRGDILPSMVTILGEEYEEFVDMLKRDEKFKVKDLYDLDCFKGEDAHHIVLKMRKEGMAWDYLEKVNKALMRKYDIKSDFPEYNPHITLASVIPGESEKYLNSKKLQLILDDSMISVDDIIYSVGEGPGTWKQSHLTNYHALDRFFKMENDKKTPLY